MADQISNGAAQPEPAARSLREVAEQAYDDLIAGADEGADDEGQVSQDEAPVDGSGQPRDAQGRFAPRPAAAQPGEAEGQQPTQPRPEVSAPQPQGEPHPAPQGSSREAPANWSAEHRDKFRGLAPEWQDFVLERHHALESDYQRKVQANAVAAQFTTALAPVFQDPVVAGSLQQAGLSPYDAISQWAQFHRRMVDPNPMVRLACWQELGQRVGLNPAAAGQMSRPGQPAQPGGATPLSEQDLNDPTIRFFADHIGRTSTDVQQLRNELQQMRQQDVERQQSEVLRVTQWGVNSFAEEKDAQGNLLHPHFDHPEVMAALIEMFRVNPQLDLRQAYDEALWRAPTIRAQLVSAEQQKREQAASTQRARQAVRSNVRGVTSPVSKPQPAEGERKGLRATLEAAADEIGF